MFEIVLLCKIKNLPKFTLQPGESFGKIEQRYRSYYIAMHFSLVDNLARAQI